MHDTTSNRAVVLGAGMAGLLAAWVLADRSGQGVVIERDVLPPAGHLPGASQACIPARSPPLPGVASARKARIRSIQPFPAREKPIAGKEAP